PSRRAHSNHAEVARNIGIDIISGRYAEGVKLPGDAELTSLFGVSRPVLRESVKTLGAKGLLSTKVRVGTVVRERAAWNMFDAVDRVTGRGDRGGPARIFPPHRTGRGARARDRAPVPSAHYRSHRTQGSGGGSGSDGRGDFQRPAPSRRGRLIPPFLTVLRTLFHEPHPPRYCRLRQDGGRSGGFSWHL